MTRRVASLMNGAYNFIIFMYQMAYGYHFSHSNAHITAISSSTPSFNSMPGRGSVSTVEERRQCITIVYDDLLWNALMVERASKQYDHVHTFHR